MMLDFYIHYHRYITIYDNKRMLYLESYGCQMNFADSEIVASILEKNGFDTTRNLNRADLVLINTCSIREKAEQTVRNRLKSFNSVKKNKPTQYKLHKDRK